MHERRLATSRLIYNGIELGYIRTQSIDYAPEYDDTGVDYLYTRVTIDVEAVLNALVTPALNSSETPAQQIVRIRSLLETPRKRLQFIVGSDTMIDSGGASRDTKSGPLPEPCTIRQIGGEQTYIISYRISTWINECVSLGLTPLYQSHRWKESVRINENGYTTKTRQGKVYTRSDITANADSLRGLIVPPIDPGFKLKNMEFTLQEDGLALMYSFEEEEQYLEPPFPATRAEGEYIESSTSPGAAVRFAEARVRLEGAKTSDKGQLLTQAIAICVNAISPGAPLADLNQKGSLIHAAAVKTSLYENKVEVTMKCMINAETTRSNNLTMKLDNFTFIPKGSDPGTLPPDLGTRGTAAIKLFANFLADPCTPALISLPSQAGETRSLSTSGLPEIRIQQTKQLPDDNAALYSTSLDNLPGFYTHYMIHTDYDMPSWNAQLPVAGGGTASAVVTLAGGTARKIVEWSAEKIGSAPKIPDPNVNDPNLVLLKAFINPKMLELDQGAATGRLPTFRRTGQYIYAIIDTAKAILDGAVPPFLDPSISSLRAIQQGDFIHGLIDNPPSSGATLSTVPNQTFRG